MQVNIHRGTDRIGITVFQGLKNLMVLTQQHLRRRNVIEAHVADPVNCRFNILDGIPRQLTVGNQRQFLVKLIIQLKKII
ncbi:Uncharacterised protein [Raoultella planticola]|uniref:Uncharacterized protein n=1 Tax=Raoultella planticola TaxID=575 RepID=A0A485A2H4_RAOPL|nr:Uncharacterised protein [Raoultella planticola]